MATGAAAAALDQQGDPPMRIDVRGAAAALGDGDANGGRRERSVAQARSHVEDILHRFRQGEEPSSIANALDLSATAVRDVIAETATDVDWADRRAMSGHGGRPAQYTRDDLLQAIRTVADRLGTSPSSTQYAKLATRLGLPSLPTITKRLGGWSVAVQLPA